MTEARSRVTIVGGGAMGGLWAARLGAAGHDVTVVDVSPALLEALGREELVVREATGETRAKVRATDDPVSVGPVDVVIVFVKGPHTAAAGASVVSLLGPATIVATLQNGWGNANVLAATVPAERLVVGVTYEGAMVEAPAVVRHTGSGPTFVGPYLDGEDAGPAARFATLLRSGGFAAEATPSVKTEIWRKLIHNSACLPVAALTGLRAAELVMAGPACNLVDALTREAVAIARAVGHEITIEERIERIHTVLSAAGNGVPSMLADVIARRATEIDQINGAVVAAAQDAGLEAPLNRMMVDLVHALESGWTH